MAKKGIRLNEIKRISYDNCYFSGGFVEGHPHDELYLQIAYPSKGEKYTLFLTPDELTAFINIASTVLFKWLLTNRGREE